MKSIISTLLDNWNNILTFCAFGVALVTGYHQYKHYKAQKPDIGIAEITDSEFGVATESRDEDIRYHLKLKVKNEGREATTISRAFLTIFATNEEIRLQRRESMTKGGRMSKEGTTAPADDEMRVPGKGVVKLKYRGYGRAIESTPSEIEAKLLLKTIDGGSCTKKLSFAR